MAQQPCDQCTRICHFSEDCIIAYLKINICKKKVCVCDFRDTKYLLLLNYGFPYAYSKLLCKFILTTTCSSFSLPFHYLLSRPLFMIFYHTPIFTSHMINKLYILGLWSVSTVAAGAVLVRRGGIYLGYFFISFSLLQIKTAVTRSCCHWRFVFKPHLCICEIKNGQFPWTLSIGQCSFCYLLCSVYLLGVPF